jgi:hypothetical protein
MSAVLIAIIAVFALGLVFGVIFAIFHAGARASRGGVQPPPGRHRGNPPFESIERDARS